MTRRTPEVNLVEAARIAADLPREGLAFKAGVSVKTIERIERGEIAVPHRTTRRAIAAVLGVDPSELWPTELAA